ncbi:hypothetical protein Droror1_Dr00025494 [Drosera rotundifolia]
MRDFVIAALLAIAITNPAFGDLVQETCAKVAKSDPTVNINFCISVLNGDSSGRTAVSIEQLELASLKLGIANATSVRARVKALLTQTGQFDPYSVTCLKDCLELYSDATYTLQQAVGDIKARDYMKANQDVSAAMGNSDTCEDQFGEKGKTSPLKKENGLFSQLTAISLAITNML